MKKSPMTVSYDESDGPLGKLLLVATDEGLRALQWNVDVTRSRLKRPGEVWVRQTHSIIEETKRQLKEYFSGQRTQFDLPLAPKGTEFQKKAWAALRKIPYGETISYQQQALAVGGANYARAVGSANRTNPIAIVVPCHRVVGKNGSMTGFLYGVDAKNRLITLEQGAVGAKT